MNEIRGIRPRVYESCLVNGTLCAKFFFVHPLEYFVLPLKTPVLTKLLISFLSLKNRATRCRIIFDISNTMNSMKKPRFEIRFTPSGFNEIGIRS